MPFRILDVEWSCTPSIHTGQRPTHHPRFPPRLRGVQELDDLQRRQHVQPQDTRPADPSPARAVGRVPRLQLLAEGRDGLRDALALQPLLRVEPAGELLPV